MSRIWRPATNIRTDAREPCATVPGDTGRTLAPRRHCNRGYPGPPRGTPTVLREADRAGPKFRGTSGHRHRECAATQRAASAHGRSERVAAAADSDCRCSKGYQPLDVRPAGLTKDGKISVNYQGWDQSKT